MNLKIRKTDEQDWIQKIDGGAIVDLSGYDNYEERQVAVLLFLRQLFDIARSQNGLPKRLIVIEEAHNYAPSIYKSHCKAELLRLAREGRKYGITLCLVSQRPRWVDPTVLSQCGSVFVFRIQNSDDKRHVFDSISLPDRAKDLDLGRLKTGEMIVAGDVLSHVLVCDVTPIDSQFLFKVGGEARDRALASFKARLEDEAKLGRPRMGK